MESNRGTRKGGFGEQWGDKKRGGLWRAVGTKGGRYGGAEEEF